MRRPVRLFPLPAPNGPCLLTFTKMGTSMQEAAEALKSVLSTLKGRKAAVLGHMRPDGDCIGSQVALCRMLQAEGVDAVCVNRDRVPTNLEAYAEGVTFIKGADYRDADRLAVAVDCADASRIGTELLTRFPAGILGNVDHHASNPSYGAYNAVVKDAAATCHVLAACAEILALKVDAATAKALHLGILTDTGRFSYASVTPELLELTARLLRLGANPSEANFRVFEQESRGKLALTQRFLSSLRFHDGGRICSGEIRQADYAATGTTKEDKEGLVEFPRSVEGVEVAVLLEEGADGVRGSLRGRDSRLRLDLLAAKLNGGGHVLAAGFNMLGCSIDRDGDRIIDTVVRHVREHSAG